MTEVYALEAIALVEEEQRRSSIIIRRLRARNKAAALSELENRPPFTSQGDLAHKKCWGVKISLPGRTSMSHSAEDSESRFSAPLYQRSTYI